MSLAHGQKYAYIECPISLNQGDDRAYVPQAVSIASYNRGRRPLMAMDCHKWRAVHHMLKRKNQRIEIYLDIMKELEDKARACYEGPLSLASHEFVEMLVLDGCFILEHFRGYAVGFETLGCKRNDPIFAMRSMLCSIRRDVMMVDDQIPLLRCGASSKDRPCCRPSPHILRPIVTH